jgi:hypothetical protein
MKDEALSFSEEAIVDFLKKYGKGPTSKDYEFVTAIVVKRFCESQWNMNCQIGFHIKPRYASSLPATGNIDLPTLADLLRNGIDESNPVDFVITRESNGIRQGMPFQVKRFGLGRKKNDTDELIAYLNTFPSSFSKVDASLAIVFDGINIDFPKLKAGIKTETFPFNRIMLLWQFDDKFCVGEIYPDYGINEYDIADFMK